LRDAGSGWRVLLWAGGNMLRQPDENNIATWRSVVVWSMLAVIFCIAAIVSVFRLSPAVNWYLLVLSSILASLIIISRFHFIRENFRSAYAVIELVMAVAVIFLVYASAFQSLGIAIKIIPGVPLIGSAASAIYFGVRAWDNLYQSELRKGSTLGRWMELWTVNQNVDTEEQKKVSIYPWQIRKVISLPPPSNEAGPTK
jgi:cytochrome c oxidase subunit IV